MQNRRTETDLPGCVTHFEAALFVLGFMVGAVVGGLVAAAGWP